LCSAAFDFVRRVSASGVHASWEALIYANLSNTQKIEFKKVDKTSRLEITAVLLLAGKINFLQNLCEKFFRQLWPAIAHNFCTHNTPVVIKI